jgi:hypothetical protein
MTNTFPKWVPTVIILLLTTLLVFIIALYFLQDKMIYIPDAPSPQFHFSESNKYGYRSPTDQDLPYRDVHILTEDNVKLHGWFITQRTSPERHPTIIFFHENAGNLGSRLGFVSTIYHHLWCNILLVSYRGYDHSMGTPTEEGIMKDGKAIF